MARIADAAPRWRQFFGIGGTNVHMILEGLNPAVRDDHDQVRAPVFIPLSAPSFEQLDELTQQLTPLLATLDASTLAYTQQVARPVFDCRRVIQVENDGTQAMLASLDNLMPDAPWGLHCQIYVLRTIVLTHSGWRIRHIINAKRLL